MFARFARSINIKLVLAIAFLLAALGILASSASRTEVAIDTSRPFALVAADKQTNAPDFSLSTPDGQHVTLSEAVKNGPVILDFWATWCGPCRAEMPELQTVYEKYKGRGVQLYGVDGNDQAEAIKSFSEQNHVQFPLLVDTKASVHDAYGVNAIPLVVIVDSNMHVVAGSEGYDTDTQTDLSRTLDKLLGA